jgi:carbonic anhydrase
VVEVPYPSGSFLRLLHFSRFEDYKGAADTLDSYQLLQFHFHAPSEHTVNGKPYDLELHLVHRNTAGELAVLGVLMSKSSKPGPFDDFILKAPTASNTTNAISGTYNIRALLPRDFSLYAYTGSLTTPPCSEGVHWLVLKQPVGVSAAAVDYMHKIIGLFSGYQGFSDNNRQVQPLNDRKVLSTR